MLETSQSPKLGFAFLEFPLVVLFASGIALDGDLGESNAVNSPIELSVAEWVGMHFALPTGRMRGGSNAGIHTEVMFVFESFNRNHFGQNATGGDHTATVDAG